MLPDVDEMAKDVSAVIPDVKKTLSNLNNATSAIKYGMNEIHKIQKILFTTLLIISLCTLLSTILSAISLSSIKKEVREMKYSIVKLEEGHQDE